MTCMTAFVQGLLLVTVLGLCATAAAADAVQGAVPDLGQDQPTKVQVYANGTFFGGWTDNSVGCLRCNFEDEERSRNASLASLSATIQPWGSMTFASNVAQSSDSVLDFWIKGSGISSVSVYIKDSATKTLSRDVRFQQAQQLQNGTSILGNDEDGFIRVQIDLSTLRTTAGNNVSDASNPAADEACVQGGEQQTFDQIVFADVSGMGFRLVLDDIKLVSKDAIPAPSADNLPMQTGMATLPPVFGQDLTELRAGVNRYSMSLKPGANFTLVSEICKELGGKLTGAHRFAGRCLTPVDSLREGNNSLSWGIVTFTVDSDEDRSAMRRALAEQVSFFEADLAGFTTIRGYQEAAALAGQTPPDQNSTGFEIPYRVLQEYPWDPDWTQDVHAEEHAPPKKRPQPKNGTQPKRTPEPQRSPAPPGKSPAPGISPAPTNSQELGEGHTPDPQETHVPSSNTSMSNNTADMDNTTDEVSVEFIGLINVDPEPPLLNSNQTNCTSGSNTTIHTNCTVGIHGTNGTNQTTKANSTTNNTQATGPSFTKLTPVLLPPEDDKIVQQDDVVHGHIRPAELLGCRM